MVQSDADRLCHNHGVTTQKARLRYDGTEDLGTSRRIHSFDLSDCIGVKPLKALKVSRVILYSTRCWMANQWRDCMMEMMLSFFQVFDTTVEAFLTDLSSGCSELSGSPERRLLQKSSQDIMSEWT